MTGKAASARPGEQRDVVRLGFAVTSLLGGVGRMRMAWLGLMITVPFSLAAMARSQGAPVSAPLPDRDAFLTETRQNLERARRDTQWSYTERRTELHMNPFGRIGSGDAGETSAYQVTPSPDGAWVERRLIERNGEPVVNGETTRRAVRRRPGGRDRRAVIDDVVDTVEFTLDRRELLHGRNTIVVAFAPRPAARPETDEGEMAKSFRGHIWVDEMLREVVRVEATALETLSFGLGMVARLGRGATVVLTREQVMPGSWQPSSIRFMGEGRALLFRKLRVDHVIEWFNYARVRPAAPGQG
jgi:hypothetical protein